MIETAQIQSETPETLCAWLDDGTSVDDLHLVTERPWARTYRVRRRRFLKVLPEAQRGAIGAMPGLARHFPDVVPPVVAVDEGRGLVLQERHDGTDLERRPGHRVRRELLVAYANLQARAVALPDLLSTFPKLDTSTLVSRLLSFLDGENVFATTAGAFLDEDRLLEYRDSFRDRADVFHELIEASNGLPLTVNHCDLRPSNVAARDDGSLIIYDWDEAVAGPAGLSLHASFSGCATPCEMLLAPETAMREDRAEARSLLSGYLRTLAANGYAEPEELNTGLPGAMCAGVVQYVLSYAHFPPPDDEYRRDIARILRRRLDDLLRLGDLLLSTSRHSVMQVVEACRGRDRDDGACRVLDSYVARNPDDADAAARLTELLVDSDELDRAEETGHRLLERHPESGPLHRQVGRVFLERLDFESAIEHLTRAVGLGETDDGMARTLMEASGFAEVRRHAARSGCVPTIRFPVDELEKGRASRTRERLACQLFREYGTLLFENAFSEQWVERMFEEYLEKYRGYFVRKDHADALRVGSRRYMITVEVAGAFNTPELYANPFVVPVIRDQLGPKMIMGGFTSVCSLPGSPDMRVHKDHPALFPEIAEPDRLGHPSFAVSAVVPLRGFNADVGTTSVVKGSHVHPSKVAEKMEWQHPEAPRGACLLMDYRLTHQGRGNRSDQVRPILTMIYHRPWFRDIVNYGRQSPLVVPDIEYQRVPEEHRPLFDWLRSTNDTGLRQHT